MVEKIVKTAAMEASNKSHSINTQQGEKNDTGKPLRTRTASKKSALLTKGSNPMATPIKSARRAKFSLAQKFEEKNVRHGEAAATGEVRFHGAVEVQEMKVREQHQRTFRITRFFTTFMAAVMVLVVYLITLETVLSCALCVGLTLYWHEVHRTADNWEGNNMDWIVLGFAVVTPLSVTITLAFRRRERALYEISRIRSFCFQIYLAHAIWNWNCGHGRDSAMNEEGWLKHTDKVLEQLVGVGDELSRVLTLPTSSRSYHRMIKKGRREAANIIEVSYRLFDSLYTQRIIKISKLSETLKEIGLAATEVSRIRQYERFIGEAIENLRMIKMYRTPQALRSFGRIFTLVLPCFYAPAFAQLAIDLNSISMGILFAILTPLVLTALFETMQIIEDPFVGWVSLDGIDVNEEMQILHFHQLISARNSLFPDAEPFEARSKAAIISLPMNSTELQKQISPLKPSLDGSQMTMERSHRVSHFSVDAIDHKPPISISGRSHQKGPLSLSGHTRDF